MSNFDDWGTPNDEWGDKKKVDSDFDFNWDPEGNFQQQQQPSKKSRIDFIAGQPLWVKIVSGVAALAVVGFVATQAGLPVKLQGMGIFRSVVSPAAACLNATQVLGELGLGAAAANQVVLSQALDHATKLKSQRSGNAAIDEAVWQVADTAFLAQDALNSVGQSLASSDAMLGEILDSFNTPDVRAAAAALTSSTQNLSNACDSPNVVPQPSESNDPSIDFEVTPLAPSAELPTETPQEVLIDDQENFPNGKLNIEAAKSATILVECETDFSQGSAFAADLSSITGSDLHRSVIITNHHVVEGCLDDGFVLLSQGDSDVIADIVAYDKTWDIAILDAPGFFTGTALLPGADVEVGQEVVTSGHPGGIATAITFGRVTLFDSDDEYLIYSDALVGPGSSGGPMLNLNGEVVGIVTYVLRDTRGMSMATPIDGVCLEIFTCMF